MLFSDPSSSSSFKFVIAVAGNSPRSSKSYSQEHCNLIAAAAATQNPSIMIISKSQAGWITFLWWMWNLYDKAFKVSVSPIFLKFGLMQLSYNIFTD